MRFYLFLLILIFSAAFSDLTYGQKEGKVRVLVKDETGKPLGKVAITVDDHNTCTTNRSGECFFSPYRKLKMPFNLTIEKKGYELKESVFYEEDQEIEVTVKKELSSKDYTYVYFLNEDKTPAADLKVEILSEKYVTDIHGMLKAAVRDIPLDKIKIEGKEIATTERKENALYITVKPVQDIADILNKDLSPKELEEIVFNQYKNDFESVTSAIIAERQRLETDNAEIRDEISTITKKLETEKNLTKEHRKELEAYIAELEKTLIQNSIAFKRTEEKTLLLMENLKKIILEKDSVNTVTIKKFQLSEEQRLAAEKRSRRNLIIFSIIIIALLLLAVVFYYIALKLRKQKKSLSSYNQELVLLKDELDKKILEVNKQKDLIEDQNKELDLFVYKASHDIKGPLKSLLGLTSIGLKTIKDENSLEIFNHIHKSITKLDRLLADLLQISKAKSASVVKTRINVKEKIQEVIDSFRNMNGSDKVSIIMDLPEDYEVNTDKNFFYSILQNFVENALKYYDPNKTDPYLKIKLEEKEDKVLLRFEDNGLGISKDHLPKIFDMFYKVNETSNGTGLGLYLVKYNIEKLGGKLNVESTLGVGSVFTVEFRKEFSYSASNLVSG